MEGVPPSFALPAVAQCMVVKNEEKQGGPSTVAAAALSGTKLVIKKYCALRSCMVKLDQFERSSDRICRCGKVFCAIHNSPIEHKCSFDHRAVHQALTLEKLTASKTSKVSHDHGSDGAQD